MRKFSTWLCTTAESGLDVFRVVAGIVLDDVTRVALEVDHVVGERLFGKYQWHPRGGERCELCVMFRRPDECTDVAGVISPGRRRTCYVEILRYFVNLSQCQILKSCLKVVRC